MENLNGCVRCLTRRSLHAFEKELDPLLPDSLGANSLKQFVIAVTVCLEEKAQIEKRLTQSALSAEKQRNQQTSQPSIAVEKGMDRLELYMYQSSLNQNGQIVFFVVKEMFKAVEAFHHSLWGRRNKRSVSRTATTNPILRTAKFTRCF